MKSVSLQETYLYKKTVLRSRYRQWGMVFLLIFLLPYLAGVFWPGNVEMAEPGASFNWESRISVRVNNGSKGQVMSMEEYLCGALPAVIPGEYEPECLKAQAILLRTGVIASYREQMEQGSPQLWEPEETYLDREALRRLWGASFAEYNQKIREAVQSTAGIYLTCNGAPIKVCYFRVSAGRTRDGGEALGQELPYLKSVECPKDYLSDEYLTSVEFSREELIKILGGTIAGVETDSAGYCQKFYLTGKEDEEPFIKSAEWVRQKLNLASTHINVEQNGGKTCFMVRGLGHGVGMSQYAANEMAKEGNGCIAILSYFFQNIAMDKYE